MTHSQKVEILHPIKMWIDNPKRFWQLNPVTAGWKNPHEATVYMKSSLAALLCEDSLSFEQRDYNVLYFTRYLLMLR